MINRITELIKASLPQNDHPDVLRIRELKDGGVSFDIWGTQAAIKYCCQKTKDYLLFSKSQVDASNGSALEGLSVERKAADNSNESGTKCRLYDLENCTDEQLSSIINAIINWCYGHAPVEFDICGRYEACSDAKQCLNPDPSIAIHCSYRAKIARGIIFFGKNRNVDNTGES